MSDATSSISSLAATSSTQGETAAQKAKIAKDMQALSQALEQNDTTAAQKAMAQLAVDTPTPAPVSSSSSTISVGNPLSAVASALNSGDIASAKSEFAAFEAKAAAHHAAKNGDASDASNQASSSPTIDANSSSDSNSSFSVTV